MESGVPATATIGTDMTSGANGRRRRRRPMVAVVVVDANPGMTFMSVLDRMVIEQRKGTENAVDLLRALRDKEKRDEEKRGGKC